jgi:death-on-curing family protein
MTKEKYPPPQVWLNIEICEAIYKAYKEVAQKAGVAAPIPEFDSRYPNALHLAKSQCFIDANKRLAVVLTNVFLRLNDYRLTMLPSTLIDLAIIIANNKSLSVEYAAQQVDQLFHLVKIKNAPGNSRYGSYQSKVEICVAQVQYCDKSLHRTHKVVAPLLAFIPSYHNTLDSIPSTTVHHPVDV